MSNENEEEYDGEVKTRRKIRYFCQYDKAKAAAVPDKKFLQTEKRQERPAASEMNKWVSVTEGASEEIPF